MRIRSAPKRSGPPQRARADFEQFVTASSDALLRTAYLVVWDPAEAEDLVQNCLLAVARRTRRRLELAADGAPAISELADESSARRLHAVGVRAELIQALGTLPPRQRAVLVLRYFEDLSEAQVAELRSALRARADDLPAEASARVRARDYRPCTRDLRPPVAAGVLVSAAANVAGAAEGIKLTGLPDVRIMTPVLTDTRGPFTFVIFRGAANANAWCISGPNLTSTSMSSGGSSDVPAAGQIVPTFEEHTASAGDAYSFVEGHAGAGMTAATLVLSDGSKVQATIQDGWVVAWWPGSAQAVSAQVTTPSGTSTQAFKAGMQCPTAPTGVSQDITCAGGVGDEGRGQAAGSMAIQGTGSGAAPASGSTASSKSGG